MRVCGGQSVVTVEEIESIWRIQTGRELKVEKCDFFNLTNKLFES